MNILYNDNFTQLISGLQASGFNEAADMLVIDEKDGKFVQLGMQIDYNDWLVITEWTKLDFDPMLFPDNTGMYLTLGRRFDSITVHYTFAKEESDPAPGFTDSIPDDPANSALIQGVNLAVEGSKDDQKSHTIGMRWDTESGAAFKLEFQTTEDQTDGGETANLISFVVDVVF